jgi:hypothetical protein
MVKEDKESGRKRAVKQTHAVIDRLEDNGMAVLFVGSDEETEVDIPVSLLPEGVTDGDHLRIHIALDRRARAAAEDRIKKLQDELKQQGGSEEKKDFKL